MSNTHCFGSINLLMPSLLTPKFRQARAISGAALSITSAYLLHDAMRRRCSSAVWSDAARCSAFISSSHATVKSFLEISLFTKCGPSVDKRLHHVSALLRHETPYPRGSHSRSEYFVFGGQTPSSWSWSFGRGRHTHVSRFTDARRRRAVVWTDNAGIERRPIDPEGNPHSRRQAVSGLDLQ
jgi:hypothetical protein